ncbi:MAG: decaprenyl-phosphate phosphoribosyltransferase [Magnetococcales bacterium]|nr:decaprenyl-phosphate phosphoribosyltransferase [Magnetococcales bacterium]
MTHFVTLMRPKQYIKNVFVLLPAFFGQGLSHADVASRAGVAFLAFCLTASAVYILNDLRDVAEDRLHPSKRNRPLASGAVGSRQAILFALLLAGGGLSLTASLSREALAWMTLYGVMNIFYCFGLKHVALLDISLIATGFVLRLLVGSAATHIPLSAWIILMTYLLALFLAMAKRRDDVLILLESGQRMRKSVDGYNLEFVQTSLAILASIVVVAYTNYTMSPEVVHRVGSGSVYLTTVFVLLGFLRYLQLALVENNSGSPTLLVLQDRFLQGVILGWLFTFTLILYR